MNTNTTTNTAATARNWAAPGEAASSAAPLEASAGSLATKEVFLELLVSQIKNQNPLNPMDGTEFLGQLSQFTQVEQTLGMRQDLARILTAIQTTRTPTATSAAP